MNAIFRTRAVQKTYLAVTVEPLPAPQLLVHNLDRSPDKNQSFEDDEVSTPRSRNGKEETNCCRTPNAAKSQGKSCELRLIDCLPGPGGHLLSVQPLTVRPFTLLLLPSYFHPVFQVFSTFFGQSDEP